MRQILETKLADAIIATDRTISFRMTTETLKVYMKA